MLNYTKGEWTITKWNEGHGFNVFSDNGFICSVALGSPPHTFLETKANAQLIASAVNACIKLNPDNPIAAAKSISDLYEALKAITSQFSKVDKLYYKDNEIISQAEQALAKAEGKRPNKLKGGRI